MPWWNSSAQEAPPAADTWSEVLEAGPTSGEHDPIIDPGQHLRVDDTAAVWFGTDGDLVLTADGEDLVVTGTGVVRSTRPIRLDNSVVLQLGTGGAGGKLLYSSGAQQIQLSGIGITGPAADPSTAALLIVTGQRTLTDGGGGLPQSGAVQIASGSTNVTTVAGTGGDSGAVVIETGSTDASIAGGQAGDTGALTLRTGYAANGPGTGGSSGAAALTTGRSEDEDSGSITLGSGDAPAGTSGDLVLRTGAAGARGAVRVQAPTVDLSAQAVGVVIAGVEVTGSGIVRTARPVRLDDAVGLEFGTDADVVLTGDGVDLVITGPGAARVVAERNVRMGDGQEFTFGADDDVRLTHSGGNVVVLQGTGLVDVAHDFPIGWTDSHRVSYESAANRWSLAGLSRVAAGADPATASVRITTGTRRVTDASVGSGSGPITLQTGDTDVNDVGGTGGASGAITLQTGAADATSGTSGDSGEILVTSGTSLDGDTGTVALQTGDSAAGDSGDLELRPGDADAGLKGAVLIGSRSSGVGGEESITRTYTRESAVFNGADLAGRHVLEERWVLRPVPSTMFQPQFNAAWQLDGTVVMDSFSAHAEKGGIKLLTGVQGGDITIFRPHTMHTNAWRTGGSPLGSSSPLLRMSHERGNTTVARVELGMRESPLQFDDGTDDDKIILRYDSSDAIVSATNYVLVTSNAGVDTLTDTGIPYDQAGVRVRWVIAVDGVSGQVTCLCAGADGRLRLVVDPATHVVDVTETYGVIYGGVRNIDATPHFDYIFGQLSISSDD